jgi:phosphopentomutase
LHQNETRPLGVRDTYADIAATLAAHFELTPWPVGESFLSKTTGVRTN